LQQGFKQENEKLRASVKEKENANQELLNKLEKASQEHDEQKNSSKAEMNNANLKLKELERAITEKTQLIEKDTIERQVSQMR
jgi:hypothetical protein